MRSPLLPALLLAVAPAAAAQEAATLAPGDPAPAIQVENWIKGGPVAAFEPGKIYVLEFWSTLYDACRVCMPLLSGLQQQYAGRITIIGVSDEPVGKVREFLDATGWAEKTRYTLCADPDRSAYSDYMKASGRVGIPCAFVIGSDGRVAWIGHPTSLERVLPDVLAGSWSLQAARAAYALEQKLNEASARLAKARSEDEANAILEEELGIMDELMAVNDKLYCGYRVQQFQILAASLKREADAYALSGAILESCADDPYSLNNFAWLIVDPDGVLVERRLDVAEKAATRACELKGREDGAMLDTLARVRFLQGDLPKAVELQQKAVELRQKAGEDWADYEKALAEYREALRQSQA